MDKDKLYQQLDDDEELTDQERREIYFAEIERDEFQQQEDEDDRP